MTVGQSLLAFVAASGLLTVTPGLDTALVLRTAATGGGRRALWTGAGICLGCLAWGVAAAVGLGALLAASQLAFETLRIVGGCYLVVVGSRMLWRTFGAAPTGRQDSDEVDGGREEPASRSFARGLLCNLLNPKVGAFYVTFLPIFLPAGVSVRPYSVLLALIHAGEGMLWFGVLVVLARPFAAWLRRERVKKMLERTTGTVLVVGGAKLLLGRGR
jgi:threonine/homoserine/homoserine lactone efflux protein